MIHMHKSKEYIKRLNKKVYDNNSLINSIFYTSMYGPFTVIEKTNKRTNDRHAIYKIMFHKTKSFYYVTKKAILSGEIKDYLYPIVSGVGFLGKDYSNIRNNDPILCEKLRIRWKSIIYRIYNKKSNNYNNYGAKGITMDSSWLNFCNFFNDITNMDTFDRDNFISGNVDIDKDIKQYEIPLNERIYSKETVTLINHKDNMKYVDYNSSAEKQSKYFIVINKDDNAYLHKNVSKFARDNNINKQNISKLLNKKLCNYYVGGYKYRYPTNDEIYKIKSGRLKIGDIII